MKWIKTILTLAVLGGAGYFGYQYYQSQQVAVQMPAVEIPRYQQTAVRKGNLSQSVTGTGSVSISEKENVALEYAVTVKRVIVGTGELVERDQALLTVDAELLETALTTLKEELATCETDIASISGDHSSTMLVKMPLYGRIKEIYIEAGQYIQDVMAERGCIALLSLDGWMMVEVDAAPGMKVNDPTKVKLDKVTLDGVVREVADGRAKISFSDAYGRVGQEIEVIYRQESIGTGLAYIHMPYQLKTTDRGYITAIYMEENARKWTGNRLAYLSNVPVSDEYLSLQKKRDKLADKIANAEALLSDEIVRSPIDGIVSEVVEASVTEVPAQTTLASLFVGDQKEMVVSVDELDIVHVQVGQVAEIKMDAITDRSYTGTVTRISQIGMPESGVTVYDVTLAVEDGDDQLRIGMNGTATVKVKEANDVLLVPISALNTSRDGQYVWVYDENGQTEGDEPGIRTIVTTGMSDENDAEVLSGLKEGDIVMITREASSNGTRTPSGNMMMNFGGGGTMVMTSPGGGSGGGGGNRMRIN